MSKARENVVGFATAHGKRSKTVEGNVAMVTYCSETSRTETLLDYSDLHSEK